MTPTTIDKENTPMADETSAPTTPEPIGTTEEQVHVELLQTKTTALGSAEAGTLTAEQSALWEVHVDGDATVDTSLVGALTSNGATYMTNGAAMALIAQGDATVSKGGAGLIVARKLGVNTGGAAAMVAGEAQVSKGYVGVLLAPKATISEDSRVIIDWKGALVLAAVLAGGLGLVALVIFLVGRAAVGAVRRLPARIPDMAAEVGHRVPDLARAAFRMVRRAA